MLTFHNTISLEIVVEFKLISTLTITIFSISPGWGDSGEHASSGAARREPPWHHQCDDYVPLPPAFLMPLSSPRLR